MWKRSLDLVCKCSLTAGGPSFNKNKTKTADLCHTDGDLLFLWYSFLSFFALFGWIRFFFRVIFLENPAETNIADVCGNGKSADHTDGNDKAECLCGKEKQKSNNPKIYKHNECVWQMSHAHQKRIADCLSGRTDIMGDNREHVQKGSRQHEYNHQKKKPDNEKEIPFHGGSDHIIIAEKEKQRNTDQPHDSALLKI